MLKRLSEGINAGLVWDAFDNLHLHDNAWAIYGLLETDTTNWTYTPKPRYYAAKQLFRYVLLGFQRVASNPLHVDTTYIYVRWHDQYRNMRFEAFVSPDKKDFTIVGTSRIEEIIPLSFIMEGVDVPSNLFMYRTSPTENCQLVDDFKVDGDTIKVMVNPRSFFTVTTISEKK